MYREIKFRVWTGEEMITPPQVTIGVGSAAELIQIAIDGSMSLRNAYGLDGFGKNPTFDDRLEFHLMQYTGRKDMNGKEIYESDWCRAEFRTKEGIQVIQGEIIMDDFMWCIECPKESGDDIYSINRPHNFEVIGNRFENPELFGF